MRRLLLAVVGMTVAVLIAGCGHAGHKGQPVAKGASSTCAHTAASEPGKCAPTAASAPPAVKAVSAPVSAQKPPVAAERAVARAVVPSAVVAVSKIAAAATPKAVAASLPRRKRTRAQVLHAYIHRYCQRLQGPKCHRWRGEYRRLTAPKPKPKPKPAPKPARPVVVLRKIVDLSNNDPASFSQLAAMKRAGVQAVILKVNQGVGFTDRTFLGMARSAMRLGLAVCGYDFVSTYTAAEAYRFVNLLHAAGIWPWTRNTCPPTLDVEFGFATRATVQNMAQIIWRSYHRAQVYTGNWYWARVGCWWPSQVTAWLSGYPYAPVPCGLPLRLYLVHQFTDRGYNGAFSADLSWFQGTTAQWQTYIQAHAAK